MALNYIDWIIIAVYFGFSLVIGLLSTKQSGKSSSEFFLSGRSMPWWLLGISMVATTFSADTPNLVTDMVRQNGVAGNWAWWAFLLTGMLTVFVYAKLWRRSGVLTDVEFYELRYSGKMAAFLRGFRALYLGVFFNVIIMATVSMALIKIGAVMFGFSAVKTLLIAAVVTVIYSAMGGLRSVLITDFFQFILAMAGAIGAAIIILNMPEIGGLEKLVSHPNVSGKLDLIPSFSNTDILIAVFILPIAVQWWSVWYPGAEPGGGGYIAQRMLSAKTEKGALKATLLFNITHYALRPWPWILVALASLVVFPDLASLQQAFPGIDQQIIRHDLAYPAMMKMLPNGFIGIVVASLLAAYMSTIATHLNWGSSYVVNDFYKRFVKPEAEDKELVMVGRISTVVLMILASIVALLLSNALQGFQIMLQIGAGTGLIFILRWFWWRVNAISELTAMVVSFMVAIYFQLIHPSTSLPELSYALQLIIGVGITTIAWMLSAYFTKPTSEAQLRKFYQLIKPGGPGWKRVIDDAARENIVLESKRNEGWDMPTAILCMVLGCVLVYSALFATGSLIYGKNLMGVVLAVIMIVAAYGLSRGWRKLKLQ